MDIRKELDHAIMLQETEGNPAISAGYQIGETKTYENYLSNESWKCFEQDMQINHPVAYTSYKYGGGKEMEERKVGNYTYPPKMASFGSSSRMIYNLMKSNSDFLYEKKLSTTIGGTANLDGFIEMEDKCVFVEAKCREPYASKNDVIANAYEDLYQFLTDSKNNNLTCNMSFDEKKKMHVQFWCGEIELKHFDIKQMICHLLGIATAYLKGDYQKDIEFIYLLYNPTKLKIKDEVSRKKILQIYNSECEECASVHFQDLFYDILNFLADRDVKNMAPKFKFRMCDQDTRIL